MRRTTLIALIAASSVSTFVACRGAQPTTSATAGATTAVPAADPNAFTGMVAETMNSGGYTYARLQGGKDDVWIAASEFSTQAGDRLTVALEMPMQNFESKTLGRTFPLVYFVSRVTRDGQSVAPSGAQGVAPALMTSHAPVSAPAPTQVEPVAPAPGGLTIADIWAKRTTLAGRQVTVRGKVVKVNNQILGRNWIHVQDGSGSADAHTNDLTVTTGDVVKIGDVITVKGVLAIDKDFGAGYAYGALVETAQVVK